jgi:hypothetical protein
MLWPRAGPMSARSRAGPSRTSRSISRERISGQAPGADRRQAQRCCSARPCIGTARRSESVRLATGRRHSHHRKAGAVSAEAALRPGGLCLAFRRRGSSDGNEPIGKTFFYLALSTRRNMPPDESHAARRRSELFWEQQTREAQAGEIAVRARRVSAYQKTDAAVEGNTARLRALRLAKEAADGGSGGTGTRKSRRKAVPKAAAG